jgi:adenine-specific DNA-methyltransferase
MANRKQKLELTWIGKDEELKLEPRILIENPDKSYGDPNSRNMLIHGDNLLALKALEQDFSGRIKCIYIDPPYNTGSAFEHYDDNLEHSTWLSLMRPRLMILKQLLSSDGVIFVQIDDEEQAYLRIVMDEVFGRSNFINTITVKMKNIAGASGGGEDKRLKKNVEFIHLFAKSYQDLNVFKGVFDLTEIYELVQSYKANNISWKYTSVLVGHGEKEYVASTIDGDGNEIRIYKRTNPVFKSVSQIAREENISERDVYYKYYSRVFTTAMPQSSIRVRVLNKVTEIGLKSELISIEYVPRSGKNRGKVYEQFYKGEKLRLLTWLSDVLEIKDDILYKKDLQGTFWDGLNLNNLTKEGSVEFPNGKKPEALIEKIIRMTTDENDYVLDSFLGSGTTAAVAHKMRRKWIGIELGSHADTHCLPRLMGVVDGKDQNGISKSSDWKGGGGFKYYDLAPSLLRKDSFGNFVIDESYNANMLAAAVCKHEAFKYSPDDSIYWKHGRSTETDFIFVTTVFVTMEQLESIHAQMLEYESLLICAKSFAPGIENKFTNITVKKIPQVILGKCEFGQDNYDLNIIKATEDQADDAEDDQNEQ